MPRTPPQPEYQEVSLLLKKYITSSPKPKFQEALDLIIAKDESLGKHSGQFSGIKVGEIKDMFQNHMVHVSRRSDVCGGGGACRAVVCMCVAVRVRVRRAAAAECRMMIARILM